MNGPSSLSVHGHWLLAALLNRYPDSELAEQIVSVFDQQFQVGLLINLVFFRCFYRVINSTGRESG